MDRSSSAAGAAAALAAVAGADVDAEGFPAAASSQGAKRPGGQLLLMFAAEGWRRPACMHVAAARV